MKLAPEISEWEDTHDLEPEKPEQTPEEFWYNLGETMKPQDFERLKAQMEIQINVMAYRFMLMKGTIEPNTDDYSRKYAQAMAMFLDGKIISPDYLVEQMIKLSLMKK